jgi:hypothetical protein
LKKKALWATICFRKDGLPLKKIIAILKLRTILWIVFCLLSSLVYLELHRPFFEKAGFSVTLFYAFTMGALTGTAIILFIHITLDRLSKKRNKFIASVVEDWKKSE